MSLKIWMPLLTNIYNQGVELVNPVNVGATASTAGVLGGSYYFNGSSNQIKASYTCAESEFTVCMWAMFTKTNVHLLDMRNSDGTGYQPMYVSTSGVQVGGSNSSYIYINFVPELNTWYHLCVTSNSSKTQLYVNGELYGETTSAKATNFNKVIDIHIGSRYSGSNWFGGNVADFRLYNEFLSPYEIRKIAQGLLLHYTHPDGTKALRQNAPLSDASGFERNAIPNEDVGYAGYATGRYDAMWHVGSSDNNYYSLTSPSANTNTISFWLRTPKTSSTVFFADYKSKMAFGFNGSGYIIATCDTWNKPMFTNTSSIISNVPCHIVVRHNSADDGVELFINGVQQTANGSNNYWTHSTDTLMIGRRSTGTPMECYFNDFRMYASRLSDNDILELYHTSLKQLSNGKSNPFEIVEDTLGKVQVKKNGLLVNDVFVESNVGNKFKATPVASNEFIER